MNNNFHKWLDEQIKEAYKAAKEASKISVNSYGAGNAWGIVYGLEQVKSYFTGD